MLQQQRPDHRADLDMARLYYAFVYALSVIAVRNEI